MVKLGSSFGGLGGPWGVDMVKCMGCYENEMAMLYFEGMRFAKAHVGDP